MTHLRSWRKRQSLRGCAGEFGKELQVAHFLFLLVLASMILAAVWTAAWSFRKLGVAALGPIAAGFGAAFCFVTALLVMLPAILTHDQNPRQPELNATEAAVLARSGNMLQCRELGGDAAWCDGFTPALIFRKCERTWFITLASADGTQVRRVLVGTRGSYDGLTGTDDDPSPGERESLAKHRAGQPEVDDDLRHCGR